jgi:prepilin-type N-terminal cleavage/methylation domain-containing protein
MASSAHITPVVERGFTLVELMLALAILVFGVTALAGSLLTGVSMRRGSEMRFRAPALAAQAVHRIQEEEFPRYADPSEPLKGFTVEDPPGYPGMKYSVEYAKDLERPGVVLAKIKVSWLEQGERMGETFRRILLRRVPFSRRVSELTRGR